VSCELTTPSNSLPGDLYVIGQNLEKFSVSVDLCSQETKIHARYKARLLIHSFFDWGHKNGLMGPCINRISAESVAAGIAAICDYA